VLNGVARDGVARLLADGTTDESFSSGSTVRHIDLNRAVSQSDGRLVVLGYWKDGIEPRGAVRLDQNGRLDPTFSNLTVSKGSDLCYVYQVFLLPDDRLLLAGYFALVNGIGRRGIARLQANGTLDESFVPGLTAFQVSAVAADSSGRLILAGSFSSGINERLKDLVRLKPDGSRDGGAIPEFRYGTDGSAFVSSIVLQSTGKLVVAGRFTHVNGIPRSSIARLIPKEQYFLLDAEFNPGGVLPFEREESLSVLAIPGTDDVFLWGERTGILRLRSDGRPDSTWNSVTDTPMAVRQGRLLSLASDGTRLTWHDGRGRVEKEIPVVTEMVGGVFGVSVQPDGKILFLPGGRAAGLRGASPYPTLVNGVAHETSLARLNPDGSLDRAVNPKLIAFGGFVNPGQDVPGYLYDYVHMPDGKIVMSGFFHTVNAAARDGMARLFPDGTLDSAFARAGLDPFSPLLAQRTGHLVMQARSGLLRLKPGGELDLTFQADSDLDLISRAVGPDDKFLVRQSDDGRTLRLNADGARDDTFIGSVELDRANRVLPLPDGKWLVHYPSEQLPRIEQLARLNRDGSLDRAFNFDAGARFRSSTRILSVIPVSENRLIVGWGLEVSPVELKVTIIRLRPDGSKDPTFPACTATVSGASSWSGWLSGWLSAILVQPDGALVLTGAFTRVNDEPRQGFARLQSVPVLRSPVIQRDGSLRFFIGGQSGWTYRIETSTDLVTWTLPRELPSAGAVTEFSDMPAGAASKFYRVRLR